MKFVYLIIILLFVDIIWLSIISKKYSAQVLQIQKSPLKINYYSGLLTYVIMAFGLYYFTKDMNTIKDKVMAGFVLGIVSYGVYDFTNGAIFEDWNFPIAIMDTIWGGILMASSIYLLNALVK